MDEDIEDYIDCLDDDLKEEAKTIVYALNNDRNKAQKGGLIKIIGLGCIDHCLIIVFSEF